MVPKNAPRFLWVVDRPPTTRSFPLRFEQHLAGWRVGAFGAAFLPKELVRPRFLQEEEVATWSRETTAGKEGGQVLWNGTGR